MLAFGLLYALFPLLFGFAAVRELLFSHRLRRVGVEALGRVVRQRKTQYRGDTYFVPTISFTTQLGQLVEAESTGNSNTDFFDGDEVLLYYDPNQPTRFLLVWEFAGSGAYWRLTFCLVALVMAWVIIR